MFDHLIVGAGFAGSVLAERLAADAGKTVLVCDKRPHIGGNAYDHHNEDGVVEEPLRDGHSVVVYDNLSKGHRDAVPDEAAFVEGDLTWRCSATTTRRATGRASATTST